MADILSTITIRLRNPRKLGADSESWLSNEGRGSACTAATCLYFFRVCFRTVTTGAGCVVVPLALETLLLCPTRLIGMSVGDSVPVPVAVFMVDAISCACLNST